MLIGIFEALLLRSLYRSRLLFRRRYLHRVKQHSSLAKSLLYCFNSARTAFASVVIPAAFAWQPSIVS